MAKAVDIIKRDGRRSSEGFSRDKLHSSVHAALISARSPEGQAGDAANRVCEYVIVWLEGKPAVTSSDLRRKASEALENLHSDAAYLYKNHRKII